MLIRANTDGTYSANWTPGAVGLYTIHVTIDGIEIGTSLLSRLRKQISAKPKSYAPYGGWPLRVLWGFGLSGLWRVVARSGCILRRAQVFLAFSSLEVRTVTFKGNNETGTYCRHACGNCKENVSCRYLGCIVASVVRCSKAIF